MITRNTPLKEIQKLSQACSCDKCKNACKYGSGFLVEEDIKKIAEFLKINEEKLKEEYLEEFEKFHTKLWRPKTMKNELPFGECVFFNNKGCKIHSVKPLECKIAMNCKDYGEELIIWFHLNYFLNEDDPESIRQYAAYLESGGKTLPEAELSSLVNDKQKLKEILTYQRLGYEQDWEEVLGIKDMKDEKWNKKKK